MDSLKDFPFLYTRDFKLSSRLSDEQLQDVCSQVKQRVQKLVQDNPRVSVVFPAYNEEMYLPLMLWTLSKLTSFTPIEIIGVNNASTDRTGEIIEQCGIFRVDEKVKGVSYARQTGLEQSRGQIIASTDADVQVPITWIDKGVSYFDEDSSLACMSGGVKMSTLHPAYKAIRTIPQLIRRITLGSSYSLASEVFFGANMFFQREHALGLGGYTPGYDLGEDNLLAQNLRKCGNIVNKRHPDLDIQVSSRRMNTAQRVLSTYAQRVFTVNWVDYRKSTQNRPQSFPDVR